MIHTMQSMNSPHYTTTRYVARHMNGYSFPVIFDTVGNVWHKLGHISWSEAYHVAEEWNAGKLTPAEACTIADHFLIAAAWADSPEGTNPRPTAKARATARALAYEFVEALGVPLFRACLDAYEAEGLHPDCNGKPCAAFGHDLLLTMDGHGAGFWDRKALAWDHNPEECARLGLAKGQTIGEKITEACRSSRWHGMHGAGYVEFYRGWTHMREPMRSDNT